MVHVHGKGRKSELCPSRSRRTDVIATSRRATAHGKEKSISDKVLLFFNAPRGRFNPPLMTPSRAAAKHCNSPNAVLSLMLLLLLLSPENLVREKGEREIMAKVGGNGGVGRRGKGG